MPLEDVLAGMGLLGVIAYAVLAGADFGGGIWDLFAAGPRRTHQREAIAHAMGPVWEANHVWLIFVIVVLFTAFPPAYAALSVALFVPFHLVLVGITLRGAAFVFRGPQVAAARGNPWGTVFGVASVITPVLLGACLGAVSAGSLRLEGRNVVIKGIAPWLTPLALTMGALALATCAYLAAVYLTNETEGELREDFRRRGLFAGGAVVALATAALPLVYWQAPNLWDGLVSVRALPVLGVGVTVALLSGWLLLRRHYRLARAATVGHVALLLLGWGLAQYPYLIYPDMRLRDAAAPEPTLRFVLYAVPAGLVVLLPSLWLLFRVFKGGPVPGQPAHAAEPQQLPRPR
ncbi:MAG: cytochrome d ubiquinol oxidase subunit II [Gemmataceae bacterium]|nr:cytochrome d ubiquinol oxidase subunit II [Gemmataceae bacterium]